MTNFGQKIKWLKCTKFDQMSRVGSRDRHAWWRSKKLKASQTRLFFIRWLVCALFSYFCSSLCILCVRRIALMKERQCTKLCKMFEEESRYNRDKLKITSHLWWQYLKANWTNHIFDRFYVNLVVYQPKIWGYPELTRRNNDLTHFEEKLEEYQITIRSVLGKSYLNYKPD